ncbi:hypothetical protein HDU98_000928 [Podochytrium sp. JEL0797]|nr:hypothetical protein HDU98_000928 [Podochytrium sp. JEL0797]
MIDMLKFAVQSLVWIKNNLVAFAIMGATVLFLWWKQMIVSQADNIVHTTSDGTRTPAPKQPVTLAALTKKAVSSPSAFLNEFVQYGVYHVKWVLAGPVVVVADPNAATVVLSDKFLCSRQALNHEAKGILSQSGSTHATSHATLVKIFSSPDVTDALIATLHARLASETFPELAEAAKSATETIDLSPVLEELWVDVVALWVLGVECGKDGKEEVERREKIVEARRCLADLTFVVPNGINWYFDRLRTFIAFTEYLPLPGSRDYLVRGAAKAKARAIIDAEYVDMVKEVKEGGVTRGGVAGRLIREAVDAAGEEGVSDAKWEEVFAECEAIQTAAQLPLMSLTPHILYLLAHSPVDQKLIYTQLAKLTSKTINRTHVAGSQLPHLTAVVMETLRLLPPFPLSYNRVSSENAYKLPGGWLLPKSTHIVVDFLNVFRSKAAFGEDAGEWRPKRFEGVQYVPTEEVTPFENVARLKNALVEGKPTIESAFTPFGGGVYACPGQKVAVEVVKVCVGEILRRFEIGVKGKGEVDGVVGGLEGFGCDGVGVLRHLEGCPVLVKRRK